MKKVFALIVFVNDFGDCVPFYRTIARISKPNLWFPLTKP